MKIISSFIGILFLMLLPSIGWGQSNEGVNFWFGFMEHHDEGKNTKVAMITSKVNTSGTIQVPKQNWSKEFTVKANDVTVINLPLNTETRGSENISNTGIQITTAAPVSVYIHQYFGFRSEATIVLPNSTLGDEYYIMTYRGIERNDQVYPSEFLIVATQNDTEINITPSDETKNGKAS